jgi:hypothetical protein
VIMDGRMSFLRHIEAIIYKLSKMLGFIKRKTLYTSFTRPNLELAVCVWSPQ